MIGLQTFTNKDRKRNYAHTAALIEELSKRISGAHFVLFGAQPMNVNAQHITDAAQDGISLRQQISLARECDAFITIDSAFYHVAHNLMRKPTLLLQSVTNEALIGDPSLGLSYPVRNTENGCQPCYWSNSCKDECLSTIAPSHVAEEFEKMITRYKRGEPLWTPQYDDEVNVAHDALQHGIVGALYKNRPQNKVIRYSIHEREVPLPDYMRMVNGVTVHPRVRIVHDAPPVHTEKTNPLHQAFKQSRITDKEKYAPQSTT